ncbi:MAG: transcriptional regulator [Thermoplasmatales archaeon B_DKE]|nr:MAG: transcriptional regulator [Thermoplasmatales archaeon B_DKE]QRF75497.1 putative HTH-type transcriptional regulator [Thermoplasmatales archaeon]
MAKQVDKMDLRLIEYLKENGRDKISSISSKLDMPRATVFERMKKLRSEGIIRNYTVNLDYEKIGFSVMAYILINFDSKSRTDQKTLAMELSRFENVLSVSIISGGWDIIILVVSQSMKDLSHFVLERLRLMDGIEKTHTITVFDSIKD